MNNRIGLVGSAFIVISALIACACSPESAFEGVLGVDTTAPIFLGCAAVAADRVEFRFSESVKLMSFHLDPPVDIAASAGGDIVSVSFVEPLSEGKGYVANILVEDQDGNTLNALAPFRGRNDRMPPLRITEIRTEYSKPKVEFVEIHVDGAGQLGGMRLVASSQGFKAPIFTFPQAEVASGEYIVVHLRTLDASSVDETDSISASPGIDASISARDFWVPGAEKLIRKTDAIALLDQDGSALDAVLFSEADQGDWAKEEMRLAAASLLDLGAWGGASGADDALLPADAASSLGTTASRTICRDENSADTDSAADWYVAATGKASPGAPNKAERYVSSPKKKGR